MGVVGKAFLVGVVILPGILFGITYRKGFPTSCEAFYGARTSRAYERELPTWFLFVEDSGMAQSISAASDLGVVAPTEAFYAYLIVTFTDKSVDTSVIFLVPVT